PPDLVGRHVLITAGGTREPLDPVRFLGNRSTGLQGYALASVAAARGAQVTLIAANVSLPAPAGTAVLAVETAVQMRDAVLATIEAGVDIVVMAAAVADFRPVDAAQYKIKKTGDPSRGPAPIELVTNPDILAELVTLRRSSAQPSAPVIVGFAAETGDADADPLEHGRAKLIRKGCDLLVVNAVGNGKAFGTPDNAAVILSADGPARDVPLGPKTVLAAAVWDEAVRRISVPPRP
ncbi:MAG: Phosphopantothenate--cysteine ligase, partial [Jatrophihabitantaceae bacterium]|nr:Phosphopantothenate--cysteine ligase [Jatrophihabitantaceae bacterium]